MNAEAFGEYALAVGLNSNRDLNTKEEIRNIYSYYRVACNLVRNIIIHQIVTFNAGIK